jgi:glutathione peroxidase
MSLYDIPVTTIDGKASNLAPYRGRVLLIVNVASQCGFTPQYAGLEDLYRHFQEHGLTILGFPCDQFGHQEPGTEAEIQRFCADTYDVTFPLFAKIDVNGRDTHPLYALLKTAAPGIAGTTSIKWNFTKFLVARDGTVMKRYAPKDTPQTIQRDIERMLG